MPRRTPSQTISPRRRRSRYRCRCRCCYRRHRRHRCCCSCCRHRCRSYRLYPEPRWRRQRLAAAAALSSRADQTVTVPPPLPTPANISVKTAEISAIRVSSKIAKTVSRHAEVQISGRFRSDPAVSTLERALRTRRPPSLNLRGVA